MKDKLLEAKPGNYLVLEQNKIFTFFFVRGISQESITIEQISIPAASFSKNFMNWKEWFEIGAPGYTAWIMSKINLNSGTFEETFSFNHQGWVDVSNVNPFLTTLLNIRFHEVPQTERRRVGLPPGHNKIDHRPIWNPRLIVNGQIFPNISFSAFKARWPSDNSELSRKYIEIYLPDSKNSHSENCLNYPEYFPYWLEVEGKIGRAKIRVIDSGVEARSPKKCLPKRLLKLCKEAKLDENGLVFLLQAPPYYREFLIVVKDTEAFFGNTFSLTYEIINNDNDKECVSLFIPMQEIEKFLLKNSTYRFIISSKENPDMTLETYVHL